MEPLLSLAFSMQSNRGVYALLLGSGVSRSAKIPTGWEVVLELVRKLAILQNADCEPEPAAWYLKQYGKLPDYSALLDEVAKTPAERQQLLRSYFDPAPDEQEEKTKLPTAAHHAIARLVADGYIKVIITTNFDRLMELALQEAGVAPLVISTPDQIEGALPLVHARCFILKVHGDYQDTRIKNTPAELAGYDAKTNSLLDQIFDQFGLITCGWSADWDEALRAAIERAPSRRFTTYWATRGSPSEVATKLIKHRAGQVLSIIDADTFFRSLQEKVEALEQFSEPHPLSAKTAVASVKKYLVEDKYRIRLHDLFDEEVTRVIDKMNSLDLYASNGDVTGAAITQKVRKYWATCGSLVAMAFTCGQWGGLESANILQRVQQRLYWATGNGGAVILLEYQRYPLTLITYAACLGAVLSENFAFISTLMQTKLRKESLNEIQAIHIVPPFRMLQNFQWAQILDGMENRNAPLNDWLHGTFHNTFGSIFTSSESFTLAFDTVEVLMALAFGKFGGATYNPNWRPPGCYGYRNANFNLIIAEIKTSIEKLGAESPYVASALIADTPNECFLQINTLIEFKGRLNWI